jgi:hypothetical protein
MPWTITKPWADHVVLTDAMLDTAMASIETKINGWSGADFNYPLNFSGNITGSNLYNITGFRQILGMRDVRAYGATGDGVTDDRAAIQAALTDMSAGGILFFPPGNYRCVLDSSVLPVFTLDVNNVTLLGAGPGASYIRYELTGGMLCPTNFFDIGNGTTRRSHINVENLKIGSDSTVALMIRGACVRVNAASFVRFHNCHFSRFSMGVRTDDCSYVHISNCHFYNNRDYGVDFYGTGTGYNADNVISNCSASSVGSCAFRGTMWVRGVISGSSATQSIGCGVYLIDPEDVGVVGCNVGGGAGGVYLVYGGGADIPQRNRIVGCTFTGGTTYACRVNGSQNVISGCVISYGGVGGVGIAFDCPAGAGRSGNVASGCYIVGSATSGSGIEVRSAYTEVSGNVIEDVGNGGATAHGVSVISAGLLNTAQCNISGNRIRNSGGYGVNVGAGAIDGTMVFGNHCRGNLTGAINIDASATNTFPAVMGTDNAV